MKILHQTALDLSGNESRPQIIGQTIQPLEHSGDVEVRMVLVTPEVVSAVNHAFAEKYARHYNEGQSVLALHDAWVKAAGALHRGDRGATADKVNEARNTYYKARNAWKANKPDAQ